MLCIYCGNDTQVVNSRLQKRANQVWRRRKCLTCGAVFTSHEAAAYDGAWRVLEQNGQYVPFKQNKLLISLYKSLEHRSAALEDATALCETVLGNLLRASNRGVLEPEQIRAIALEALQHFDNPAAVHYAAFHPNTVA